MFYSFFILRDSDNDGISDAFEAGATWPTLPVDTDGDGLPDYQDEDSDADGISDAEQKGPATCCLGNGATPAGVGQPIDTDGDAIPDYKDTDSDGDAIFDVYEKGNNPDDPTKAVDTDGDGTPDYLDLDSDDDGIADSLEFAKSDFKTRRLPALDGNSNNNEPFDTDGDGIPDFRDDDSDNDGVLDSQEKGAVDCCAPLPGKKGSPVDADGNGIPDYRQSNKEGGVNTRNPGNPGENTIKTYVYPLFAKLKILIFFCLPALLQFY